jgi:hypothetical protein
VHRDPICCDLQVDPEDLFKLILPLDEYNMVIWKRERRLVNQNMELIIGSGVDL